MTRVGKTLQFVQHDHEAQVQVGAGRIDAELDAERTPELEARAKIVNGFDVFEAVEQELDVRGLRVGGHPSSIIVTPPEPSSSCP